MLDPMPRVDLPLPPSTDYLRGLEAGRAETAAAVAAALEAVKAEARKVKPLEWGQEGKQPEHAVSIIGTYLLMKDFDGWRWMRVVGGNLADVCEAPFATLEAAKAAAQADYEARILAALDKP